MECDKMWERLHNAIEEGKLEEVKELLVKEAPGQYFSYDETSALYKAFLCKEYEIASFLIHKHAKLDESEVQGVSELDLTRINNNLLVYNRKSEKSCVYKLISCSQSPQGFDGERLSAVMRMYEEFFESEMIKLLMMVLEEGEALDIVYDFESEDVNGIQRLFEEESEIFGLTLVKSKEVFIGAKNLLCGDPMRRAKVYSVVAEQICHLAMTILFENNAKPYREEDSKLKREFREIVLGVKSLLDCSVNVESIISEIFTNYDCINWECELIARVVMMIGMYGEEKGKEMLKQTSELSRLLSFYEMNVVPKCRMHTDPSLNTKTHHLMEKLMRKNDFISFREKKVRPLKESFPSFREFVVDEGGISVISTNCTKLCMLHVYHELKREYGDLLEKKCLFLTKKCFELKAEEILNALKCGIWEYLVVVIEQEDFSPEKLRKEYLDDLDELKDRRLITIVISVCKFSGPKSMQKAANYKWDDLSEEFQDLRTYPIEYVFKDERHYLSRKKEDIRKLFSEKDILKVMSGEVFVVKDGSEVVRQDLLSAMYTEREFQATIVDVGIFNNLPPNCCVFLSGVSRIDFQELPIDGKLVQWIRGSDDKIMDDKSVFIVKDQVATIIEASASKKNRREETTIWLNYDKGKFYVRNSSGSHFREYMTQVSNSEEEIIDVVRRKRVVIISDEAGCGKSAVLSSLMRRVNRDVHGSWVSRVDLSEFWTHKVGLLSLSNEEDTRTGENMFEDVFLMLGLNSEAEKCCFRDLSHYRNCFLFLDAFDEIPMKYKAYALRMISFLRENTNINFIITARKQCQQELEDKLNTYSYHLAPFSDTAQASYLGKLWKWKLKFPYGEGVQVVQKDKKAMLQKIEDVLQELRKVRTDLAAECQELILALEKIDTEDSLDVVRCKIDRLDFTSLAVNVLRMLSTDEDTSEIMRIPMNLYVLGINLYNANFKVEIFSDIYALYSGFIERKVQIYMEEKLGFRHEGRIKDSLLRTLQKDVYRVHGGLANQLIARNTADLALELDEEDQELCSTLGVVSLQGRQVKFIHKSFAEFFRTVSMRQN